MTHRNCSKSKPSVATGKLRSVPCSSRSACNWPGAHRTARSLRSSRARHLPAADRNQHHGFHRKHHARRAGDGEAAARCRLSGRRREGARPQRPQGEHGGALPRQAGIEAEADPDHRPPRRGGGAPRGLDHRSLPVRREGRLLLRARHAGHEGQRRHRRDRLHPPEEGGLRARTATSSWRSPRTRRAAHPTASTGCSRTIAT